MIWGLFGYRLFFAESNSASAFQNLIFIKTDSHGFRDAGDIAGEVTRKIEAECNQTPPWLPYSKVPFPKSPENLSKPNSLAGGILKCRIPNRPLCCYSRTCLNPYPSVDGLGYGLLQVMGFDRYAKNRLEKSRKNQ